MPIPQWLPAILIALAAVTAAHADEEFDKLLKDFEDAQQKFYDKLQADMEKAQKDGTPVPAYDMSKLPPFLTEFRPRFQALADKNAGKPAAIDPLVWLASTPSDRPQPGKPDPGCAAALKTLAEKYASDPAIAGKLEDLQAVTWFCGSDAAREFYERVARENKDKEARAGAQFQLALMRYEGDPLADREEAEDVVGKRQKEAIELFRKLVKDFPGTRGAASAEPFIFELDRLQVGMLAPDFEGKDLDGKTIKLSQFRGKVVVIDFWGFW